MHVQPCSRLVGPHEPWYLRPLCCRTAARFTRHARNTAHDQCSASFGQDALSAAVDGGLPWARQEQGAALPALPQGPVPSAQHGASLPASTQHSDHGLKLGLALPCPASTAKQAGPVAAALNARLEGVGYPSQALVPKVATKVGAVPDMEEWDLTLEQQAQQPFHPPDPTTLLRPVPVAFDLETSGEPHGWYWASGTWGCRAGRSKPHMLAPPRCMGTVQSSCRLMWPHCSCSMCPLAVLCPHQAWAKRPALRNLERWALAAPQRSTSMFACPLVW